MITVVEYHTYFINLHFSKSSGCHTVCLAFCPFHMIKYHSSLIPQLPDLPPLMSLLHVPHHFWTEAIFVCNFSFICQTWFIETTKKFSSDPSLPLSWNQTGDHFCTARYTFMILRIAWYTVPVHICDHSQTVVHWLSVWWVDCIKRHYGEFIAQAFDPFLFVTFVIHTLLLPISNAITYNIVAGQWWMIHLQWLD